MKSGLVWALTLLVCASPVSAAQPVTASPETSTGKTRLFVLTDIEAEETIMTVARALS